MAIDVFLKFEYLNPRTNAYAPYPRGIVVKAWDHDLFSPDDFLAEGLTDSTGRVHLTITKEKIDAAEIIGKPDIYFKVYPEGRTVDGIPLPKVWSSRNRMDTKGRRGYYKNFGEGSIGSADNPVTFRIHGLNAYVEFYYYNQGAKRIKPLPENVTVEMRDYDPHSHDELLGVGVTDSQGRAFVTAHLESVQQEVSEGNPEVYFRVNTQGICAEGTCLPACESRQMRSNYGAPGYYPGFGEDRIGDFSRPRRYVLGPKHFIRVGFVVLTAENTDTESPGFQSKVDRVRTIQGRFKDEYIYATYGRSCAVGMQDVAVIKMDGHIPSIGSQEGQIFDFLKGVGRKFYETHGDFYDYLAVYEDFGDATLGSRHYTIKNDIEHIGMDLRDRSGKFGSAGVLRGIGLICDVNELPDTYSFRDSQMHLLLHETVGHQYGIYGLDRLKISDSIHFDHYVAAPAFSILYAHPWRMTLDGRFLVVLPTEEDFTNGFFVRFHPLVMYNMGLFTPEEVGSIMVVDTAYEIRHRYDGPATPVEGSATFYSMEEIIEEWGGTRRVV